MPNTVSHDYKGWVVLKKTAGNGPGAVGTQYLIPTLVFEANNPVNTSYPVLINSAVSIVNGVIGKRTPNVTISTVMKGTSITANLLLSLLTAVDAFGDTDQYSIAVYDGLNLRIFDECRCAGVVISASAIGGAIMVQMSFLARYGDSQAPYTTVFATPSIDAGYLSPVSQVGLAGTADLATGFQVSLLRAQGYLAYFDQTIFMSGIASGMLTGTLALVQSPRASTVPNSSFILQLGVAGAGIQIQSYVNLDSFKRDHTPALGSMSNNFSLVDLNNFSGNGQAIVITAL